MNIVFPLNGVGKRFQEEGYEAPKPLINILGKPMIFWVLENLKIAPEDTIHFVYNSSLDEYGFSHLIKNKFPNLNFNFITLKQSTRGAAETILCGLEQMADIEDSFVMLDCDTVYYDDVLSAYRDHKDNRIFYFNDTDQNPIYSYIKIENNKVSLIKEKDKISDNANTGAYCFRSGLELKQYCEKLLASDKAVRNEFYTSGIYDIMISDGIDVYAAEVKEFYCVGTPIQLKWFASLGKNKDNLRICFDLDNTIVSYPEKYGDYSTCAPIHKVINFVKFLKSQGHKIIIYTARRMRTHNGDVKKVVDDIGEVTLATLADFGVPYDELHFGKPYANFYIDDLAVNPKRSLEKQLGFYETSIESRQFHEVLFTNNKVVKKGNLSGEKYWYDNIPSELNFCVPKILKNLDNEIHMERINGIPYSYLYINSSLTERKLVSLLDLILDFKQFGFETSNNIYENYASKLSKRYKAYDYTPFVDSENIFIFLSKALSEYEQSNRGVQSIIHGDLVFTNVFLDIRGQIKLIDPRGRLGSKFDVIGDILYDYSKVFQSLMGYDSILLNKKVNDNYANNMLKTFEAHVIDNLGRESLRDIKIITASLFFTLIPLHNNEKCAAYYDIVKQILEDLK